MKHQTGEEKRKNPGKKSKKIEKKSFLVCHQNKTRGRVIIICKRVTCCLCFLFLKQELDTMAENTGGRKKNRTISIDIDPLEPEDLYYGPNTDPSNAASRFSRLRTRSVVAPKQTHTFSGFSRVNDLSLNEDDNSYYSKREKPKFTMDQSSDDNDNDLDNDVDNDRTESEDKDIDNGKNKNKAKNKNKNKIIDNAYQRIDTLSFEDLRNLKNLSISPSGTNHNTPIMSESESDYESNSNSTTDSDPQISSVPLMKIQSTGSLIGESEISLVNSQDKILSSNETESDSELEVKNNEKPKTKNNNLNVSIPFPKSTEVKNNIDRKSLSPSSPTIRRRGSADLSTSKSNSKRFFISDIDATLNELLHNEDTDHNCQITIEDTGPKVLKLGTANSAGFKQYDIRGTYMLSNLLQELTIAKRFGRKQMILDEARLNENPVSRLKRLITTSFWKNLTRQVNDQTILEMAKDTKINSKEAKFPRIYIPFNETEQYDYYLNLSKKFKDYNLQVEYLPKNITEDFVKSINNKPGLLSLAVRHKSKNYADLEGFPYIVPGGRFNEQYGWDSYFETLGLLSCDILEPCIGMCENFIFEINHYYKILNANRSYYLCRSQPPFLTDMVLKIFDYINLKFGRQDLDLLKRAILAAIKEYNEVWCSTPRLDPISGLSTYHPDGKGIPPETESSHFNTVLKPYCDKYNMNFKEFTKAYNEEIIKEPKLDEYFLHDRAVRESGHDTSYRLEGICANLATVDLNCLLYKYEKDIAFVIKKYFNNGLEYNGNIETSEKWENLSNVRKNLIEKYMWNEKESLYFDYNIKTKKQSTYESVTSFYVLWAGLCSEERANILIMNSLHKFEEFGGLVSGTEKSRGEIGVSKPSRQWDYPFAWAPHQILVWDGLKNYKRFDLARRLSYRWLYLMTLAFVDFNGIVVEKYDATSERQPHKVEAEYGNQGSGFKGVATEGFGWVNASYLLGLENLDTLSKMALGMVTSPVDFFTKMNPSERVKYGLN